MTEKEKKMRAELAAANEEAERGQLAAAAAAALPQCSLSTLRVVYGYIRDEVSFDDRTDKIRSIISMLQDLSTKKLDNLYYLVLYM